VSSRLQRLIPTKPIIVEVSWSFPYTLHLSCTKHSQLSRLAQQMRFLSHNSQPHHHSHLCFRHLPGWRLDPPIFYWRRHSHTWRYRSIQDGREEALRVGLPISKYLQTSTKTLDWDWLGLAASICFLSKRVYIHMISNVCMHWILIPVCTSSPSAPNFWPKVHTMASSIRSYQKVWWPMGQLGRCLKTLEKMLLSKLWDMLEYRWGCLCNSNGEVYRT